MKQLLHIVLLCALSAPIIAQDSIPECLHDSTPEIPNTSTPDSLVDSSLDSLELPIFFDEALAWLDTTECTSDTLIAELPDSVYKSRLQALPFVIEVPYNEVVRRYILRYVKHSPRQLASLQR